MLPSLARRYRPSQLSDLVGQEALVRTLTNDLAKGRTAQAYVLTGIRGVGKTSTARIIARSLNCEQGPTATPCGVCENCKAFDKNAHPALMEIDAASNSGIESVRALQEQLPYAPMLGRYKVIVVDEAHGLSKNAWEAFLKTLEEPPQHVVFVFATTEARKIPATVLSRCQTFSLRRIGAQEAESRLKLILDQERALHGLPDYEPQALAALARAGEGSMRDSVTILEQALSRAGDQPLTAQLVADITGSAARTDVLRLLYAVLERQSDKILQSLNGLFESGALPESLAVDVLEACHIVAKTSIDPTTPQTLGLSAQEIQMVHHLAKTFGMNGAQNLWQTLSKSIQDIRESHDPEEALEMLLLRVAFAQ